MRILKVPIVIIFTFFFVNSLLADTIPIYTIGNEGKGFKNFTLGLIVDSTRTLQIEDAINLQANAKNINSHFTIPSIEPNYWFILKLHNPLNINLIQTIGFNEACFEVADIYYEIDDGWHYEKNGLNVPLKQRSMHSRWPIFEVSFEPNETKTIFLKLHSEYLVPLCVVSENVSVLRNEERKQFVGYWFYFGAAISILFYNLFLFFQVKDRTYLFYVFYLFFLILWISLWSGFLIYISSSLKLYYFLSAGVPVMSIFIILFTRELLQIKQICKWIDNVLISLCIVSGVFALLVIYDIYYYQFLGSIGMGVMLFLFFTGFYALWKKVQLSRFYLLATSFYLFGLFIVGGLTIGVIPYNSFSRYGFIVGSFIEFTLFSFALGYRIRLLQLEKIRYQNEIIETERSAKKNLEVKVLERTEELIQASEKLASVNEELSFQIQEKDNAIEALKLSDKELQLSNRSKDRLFSIIAHDLMSPFNSILGFLDLLKNRYSNYSEVEKIDLIDRVYESSKSTFQLLENLLIWSRSQLKRIVLTPTLVDLNLLIQNNFKLLILQANRKEIKLISLIQEKINIYVDEEMISVVIRNLLSNAIKFTDTGGTVTISVENYKSDASEIRVLVKDTGVGLTPEQIQNIFQESKHESTSGTNSEKGTGLGLILCKEFIEGHSGRIWVESEIGKGSTFQFTLPLKL